MFGRRPKPDAEPTFQAVVRPAGGESDLADQTAESASVTPLADDGWSVEEIETAYLRALDAAQFVDAPLTDGDAGGGEAGSDVGVANPFAPLADATPLSPLAAVPTARTIELESADDAPRVTPRQIVEALLFVGGRAMTSRQLADVLGGSTSADRVDDVISDLNAEYVRQQRPYEIHLGAGGYRLELRSEFDKVRARVFGIGPRDVKLAQHALEVLALVAYQQPLTREAIESSGIQGVAGLLRQLLRRELVILQRGDDGTPDVYHTTDRFLKLFGLTTLTDLPRPDAVHLR